MAGDGQLKLKALTLNCWGLYEPISKLRTSRIKAIGEELAKSEYDIVMLQEIWIESDYELLCSLVLKTMPYVHYFHSGMFGSGLCIFSKYPIMETFQHAYRLCGFPHKVMHGDWFGGKAVGLAVIQCAQHRINVYVTHTHAGYGAGADYATHKAVQAYELSQFIRQTSSGCDGVLVAGDLNDTSDHPYINLIKNNANLHDAWSDQRCQHDDNEGNTSNSWPTIRPTVSSSRIDYILYRNNTGFDMICDECFTTMKKIPGQTYNFSDHLGVAAHFTLKRNITVQAPCISDSALSSLEGILPIVEQGLRQAQADRVFFSAAALICLIAIGLSGHLGLWSSLGMVDSILRTVLTLGAWFCAWMGIVTHIHEVNALLSVQKDIFHRQRHAKVNFT